jgi:simple sugar transport system ATP-binding protein/ribose transport system ATP-binding protein
MTRPLELRAATKEFRGVPAIRNIDFALEKNEIHAIVGENGAGKSTLTKILSGVYQLTSGEMLLDGKPVRLKSPAEALDAGIAMVFQETNLVPSMTVAQNIYLGDEKLFNRLRGLYIQAQRFLLSLNFYVDPVAQVSSLGAGKKQMVEIARAVHHKVRVIIFDEPTATLTPEEKFHFFNLARRLRDQGISIIFISHALEEALLLSDRITVLRDGELVVTDRTENFDRERIIQAMVGRSLSGELYGTGKTRVARPYGEKVLSVENVSMGSVVRNTSFSVYAGQVTGMFGLVGAGRTETMKIVAGVLKRDFFHGGSIRLRGRPVRYRTPRPAVLDGIVYVTEDRKVEGFFLHRNGASASASARSIPPRA